LPLLDPPSLTFLLPDEFAPNGSYVSPDGRFVAARARDWGRVVLYRITRPSPRASLAQIAPVAEVRGFAQEMSWLEDSSAVLVGPEGLRGGGVGGCRVRARPRVAARSAEGRDGFGLPRASCPRRPRPPFGSGPARGISIRPVRVR